MNALRRAEVEGTCLRIYRETLDAPGLDPADDFAGAGGDSIKAVLITTELEAAFGVEVAMRTFFEKASVREMADWLCEALSRAEGTR
ncbi:acyl carrier protein [Arenibaculum sp.]|uniref:acyl carrier protein n=1 Tax=Arenibaculum sp. TaxID=2865862 RepID=UPI002E0F441E|nr:acyl carrier protein [Arenibaculum sp.]